MKSNEKKEIEKTASVTLSLLCHTFWSVTRVTGRKVGRGSVAVDHASIPISITFLSESIFL